jgi:hypothetical protein
MELLKKMILKINQENMQVMCHTGDKILFDGYLINHKILSNGRISNTQILFDGYLIK